MIRLAVLVTLFATAANAADLLVLRVRETAGVARNGEVVRSGVPLPRSLNVRSTDGLAIVDATGRAVAAEFHILARWNAARADTALLIQWLLISFPATVGANGSAEYRLVTDGSVSNPAPPSALKITRTGNQVVVDTGVATFIVDGDRHSLFEEIRRGSTAIVNGGSLTLRANDGDAVHASLRRMSIERSGPLTATVVVDGAYDFPQIGGGGLGSQRRYEFNAGSPTAIVRHSLAWEGDRCGAGSTSCGGAPNGVRVQRVRDTLRASFTGAKEATIVGDRASSLIRASVPSGQTASLRQRLRSARTDPPRYESAVAAAVHTGAKADGSLLAVSAAEGTLAVALDHMHRYEPQAIRFLEDGSVAVDVADDQVWLSSRQGLFGTMAVSALPPAATRSDLESAAWAPLNHPLRAWPDARWFATSDAIDDVPVGILPADFSDYDPVMNTLLQKTITSTDDLGVYGLMTWGLFPRTWADPILSDEIDCFDNDPTPQDRSDNLFWCSTWTDYHNATLNAPIRAMRTGEVEWLDEISRPAALRSLHTQIFQCSPTDDYFYCGQAPAGYGGYRTDFNGSHAYFENLQLYYWLTGDYTVVETLLRGSRSMRDYFCSRRPASACGLDDPPTDEFANLTGRVAGQWFSVFRFVGLASEDPSYLEDYRANIGRAITQQYVAVDREGARYGFILGGVTPVLTGGINTTDQLWMTALYDMRNLERLRRDTGDAPIGSPAMRPSEVITSFARMLQQYGPNTATGSNGSVFGPWPNSIDFTWSGNRVGGTLVDVRANPGGSDPLLYETGKSTLAGPMAAGAMFTGDNSLRDLATDLVQLAIDSTSRERAPLGKIPAELTVRLHSAIAKLVPPAPTVPRRRAVRR